MNLSLITYSVLLLLAMPLTPNAQGIEKLTIEKVQAEGLTNKYVTCITQDKNGFLWLGTREGLFRYDGYTFKSYGDFSRDSLPSAANWITTLYADSDKIWIGSRGGLCYMDINTQGLTLIKADAPVEVSTIYPMNDSTCWVGTATGLFVLDKKNHRLTRAPFLDGHTVVNALCADRHDHLYAASGEGFYRLTLSTHSCKHYSLAPFVVGQPDPNVPIATRKIIRDHSGTIWISTWGLGVLRFDPAAETIVTRSLQPANTPVPVFDGGAGDIFGVANDMLQDDNGNIWVAHEEGGITVYDTKKHLIANHSLSWNSEAKPSDNVQSLFQDRTGIVWVGTINGLYKYDPHRIGLSRQYLMRQTDTGLTSVFPSLVKLFAPRPGVVWAGTYDGLFSVDPATGIMKDIGHAWGIPDFSRVFEIEQDADSVIWLSAENKLGRVDEKKEGRDRASPLQLFASSEIKSPITALYIDHEKRVWVGTHRDGIFLFDRRAKKFVAYPYNERNARNNINEIRCFEEISPDSLLAGGGQTGLLLLHPNELTYDRIYPDPGNRRLSTSSINTICHEDRDIWIGTEFDGLWQTDGRLKTFTLHTLKDGLPSMNIGFIAPGPKRRDLWLLTHAGAVYYQLSTHKVTVLDDKDGIRYINELNTLIVDSSNILIGDRGSIYTVNPSSLAGNPIPPPVYLTDFKVFDKEYPIRRGETIKLGYDQNYFSFEFIALNFTQPQANKYAFRLDGLDDHWIEAGSRRYASYANLAEGTYTFEVKACNNEGLWNDRPASLTIIIRPPFWRTWWFYVLVALAVAGTIFVMYRYNLDQFEQRLRLRNKIARDLHDDIGSSLSGISIFSKVALQKKDLGPKDSREVLEKISQKTVMTLDALSDIVWSINTRNDSMTNFLAKAREYLAEVLEPSGIKYDLYVDKELEQIKMDMVFKKELYLLFKEAICNAVKYAGCSRIDIAFTREAHMGALTIQDDGKGFDSASPSTGNGLYNMRQRAERLKAVFKLESTPGRGTLIHVKFPLPQNR